MLDFRRLEVFIEVVQTGTFSRAAEKLFLTQPTVSSHISILEKELGVTLFERRGRKVVLTPAGQKFLPYARDLVGLKSQALSQMDKYKTEVGGQIKIIASSTPGTYLLPALIGEFKKTCPQISFEIILTNSSEVKEKVGEYQFDLGIVGEGGGEKNLCFIPLKTDRLVGICPPGHRFSGQAISLSELKGENFIFRGPGSATRRVFENKVKEKGFPLKELGINMEINNLEGIKTSVRAGLGISFVSEMATESADTVEIFTINDFEIEREIYCIYNPQRVLAPWGENFLNFLKQRSIENGKDISG